MSKRISVDTETPSDIKKGKTEIDVISGGNKNCRDNNKNQSIRCTCIEDEIYEEIQKNGNNNNYFFNSIIQHNLSAAQVNTVFWLLIENLSTEFLEQVISSTVNKWNILKVCRDSHQIKILLSFLIDHLDSFSNVLYNEQNNDGENLLHILSQMEDLTVLLHFLTNFRYRFKPQSSKQFIKSTRRDGSNFCHLIFSKRIENPKLFIEIIERLQMKLGKELIAELVKGKTKQGEDVFNVICQNQESETFVHIWDWFVNGYQDLAIELAKSRDNDGQNIPQTMFEFNSNAQESIPCVIRSINDGIGEYLVLEDLVTGKNKKNNNLCHMVFEGNRRLFVDILQMKELDKNLIEKIFFLPESNNERVMDKLCKNLTHFKNAVSTVHSEHGLDITRSILYNGDEIGNPVLLKIINDNEMPIALQFLDWVLKEYKEAFTFEWLRKRNRKLEIVQDNLKTDVTKHEKLCQWVFDNLNTGFVENITKEEPKKNGTILLYYSEINHEALFWSFLKSLFDKLDQNKVLEILRYKDNYDDTFLFYLCSKSIKITFVEVFKFFLKNLDPNNFVKLLLSKQGQGYSFLHLLCERDDKISFRELLELLFDNLDQNDVEKLLLIKRKDGCTFMEVLFFIEDKSQYEQVSKLLEQKLDANLFEKIKYSAS